MRYRSSIQPTSVGARVAAKAEQTSLNQFLLACVAERIGKLEGTFQDSCCVCSVVLQKPVLHRPACENCHGSDEHMIACGIRDNGS